MQDHVARLMPGGLGDYHHIDARRTCLDKEHLEQPGPQGLSGFYDMGFIDDLVVYKQPFLYVTKTLSLFGV